MYHDHFFNYQLTTSGSNRSISEVKDASSNSETRNYVCRKKYTCSAVRSLFEFGPGNHTLTITAYPTTDDVTVTLSDHNVTESFSFETGKLLFFF